MTRLEELLERAAESDPIQFDAEDVRRRVQRRTRVRRSLTAAVGVLLVVGAVTVAVETGDQSTDRVDVTDDPNAVPSLERRWTPIAYSAVIVPPDGVYLEFRDDGTLRGHDGCNAFGANWEADGDRLVVSELQTTKAACPVDRDTRLAYILQEGPTIGIFDGQPGTLLLSSDDGFVAFGSWTQGAALSVEGIDITSSPDGAQRIEIAFDGPLPDNQVTYIEDITSADTPGLAYTIQDPSGLHICDDVHWFGAYATGTIDILIPSRWLDLTTPVQPAPPPNYVPAFDDESVDHPGKIVTCGPHNRYVQYSIWGPASDNPSDVRVSVGDDSTRLVIEVQPDEG